MAAFIGGYALTNLFSVAVVKVLVSVFDHELGDSVLIGTMLSHLLFFIVFILCFCPFKQHTIWLSFAIVGSVILGANYFLEIP